MLKRGSIISVDITYRCNLNCRHCYFKKQKHRKELGDDEWIRVIKKYRENGTLFAIILGGEPLLRKELVLKINEIMPIWLVTNGTLPIPRKINGKIFISIDGTREVHDYIRGKGTYDKIMKNVEGLSEFIVTTVINTVNWKTIPEMVDEWINRGAKAFFISLHTPPPYELALIGEERKACIEMLRRLTKEYGEDVMWFTDAMLDSMLKADLSSFCGCRELVISLDPIGNVKIPCEMAGQDCRLCGLHIAHLLTCILKGDRKTINLGLKILR